MGHGPQWKHHTIHLTSPNQFLQRICSKLVRNTQIHVNLIKMISLLDLGERFDDTGTSYPHMQEILTLRTFEQSIPCNSSSQSHNPGSFPTPSLLPWSSLRHTNQYLPTEPVLFEKSEDSGYEYQSWLRSEKNTISQKKTTLKQVRRYNAYTQI